MSERLVGTLASTVWSGTSCESSCQGESSGSGQSDPNVSSGPVRSDPSVGLVGSVGMVRLVGSGRIGSVKSGWLGQVRRSVNQSDQVGLDGWTPVRRVGLG